MKTNIFIVLILLFCSTVYAKTCYIAKTGTDSGDCTSSACLTISYGISQMSSSDTLEIADGLYQGNSNIISSVPNGFAGSYTKIQGANISGAILDGENSRNMMQINGNSYVQVIGLKVIDGSDYSAAVGVDGGGSDHIIIQKCAFKGGSAVGDGDHAVFQVGYSNNILVEECWSWGNGRYKFHSFMSNNVTFRRNVVRFDTTTLHSGRPQFGMSGYNSNNNIYENNIIIDGLQQDGGGWGGILINSNSASYPSYGHQILGNIVLDNNGTAIYEDTDYTHDNTYTNNVVWRGKRHGIAFNKGTDIIATHNTAGACGESMASEGRGISVGDSVVNELIRDSITYNNYYAIIGNTDHTYINAYGNDANGNFNSSNIGCSITDPEILYIVRVESTSDNSGSASDGGDIGANAVNRYVDGSLTGTALWPFPNEGQIKTDMTADSTRGFCATTANPRTDTGVITLTSYIWEYLGNTDMTATLYGDPDTTPPTVTAFAIPSTYTSIPVPVITFTATDDTSVTGYIVTASAVAPAYTESGWTPTPPTALDFLAEGVNTVYAWAKDAAGNVSTSVTDDCTVTLPEPGVTWEVQPTWGVTWEDQPTWQVTFDLP